MLRFLEIYTVKERKLIDPIYLALIERSTLHQCNHITKHIK